MAEPLFEIESEPAIDQLGELVGIAPEISLAELKVGMEFMGQDAAGELIRILPVDVGTLRNSVSVKTEGDTIDNLDTRIFPSAPADKYALFVEKGRGPGGVDRQAIVRWAERKGIGEFGHAIATKIARQGTRRHRNRGQEDGEWKLVKQRDLPRIVNRRAQETATAIANKIAASINTGKAVK